MSRPTIWSLALYASIAQGFQNTSPFFAFSDKHFDGNTSPGSFVKASNIRESITSDWLDCASRDVFVVVSQPGVSAADYHSGASAPYMRRSMGDWEQSQSKIAVSEVLGELNAAEVTDAIAQKCGITQANVATSGAISIPDQYPQVLKVDLPAVSLDPSQREHDLLEHDSMLHAIIETTSPRSYSVFYVTSPSTAEDVHKAATQHSSHLSHHKHGSHKSHNAADDSSKPHAQHALNIESGAVYSDALHMGLKRDIMSHRRDEGNSSSNAPLFEKYNFLNKGIFMGGVIVIILFSILYVGVSAVASVEITPFAFSKEMGPQNQKKQQ